MTKQTHLGQQAAMMCYLVLLQTVYHVDQIAGIHAGLKSVDQDHQCLWLLVHLPLHYHVVLLVPHHVGFQ